MLVYSHLLGLVIGYSQQTEGKSVENKYYDYCKACFLEQKVNGQYFPKFEQVSRRNGYCIFNTDLMYWSISVYIHISKYICMHDLCAFSKSFIKNVYLNTYLVDLQVLLQILGKDESNVWNLPQCDDYDITYAKVLVTVGCYFQLNITVNVQRQ